MSGSKQAMFDESFMRVLTCGLRLSNPTAF
jgi:hypothetical protein